MRRYQWIIGVMAMAFVGLGLLAFADDDAPQKAKKEQATMSDSPQYNDANLTDAERRVILHKGTERPFSGKYVDHHEDGTYRCKRCGAELFQSDTKFNSECGWPSFDDAIDGAVKEVPDADGMRTEIVCANCGAHLGHVFRGEGFTPKNTRHCVNSISLTFSPADADAGSAAGAGAGADADAPKAKPSEAAAYFAGGCFWGVEYWFEKVDGVKAAVSGYMGGTVDEPSYEQVCTGATGHAETVKIVYDPGKVDYETLARLFFEIHDPTQVNRQGPDIGEQYRSVVFVENAAERKIVEQLIAQLEAKGLKVATKIEDATTFYPAEAYHQDYYEKTGKVPYCHSRVERF